MIAANVLSKEEFPDFDEETGILPKVDDEEGMSCIYLCLTTFVAMPINKILLPLEPITISLF